MSEHTQPDREEPAVEPDAAPGPAGDESPSPGGLKVKDVTSLPQFLEYAYSRGGKILSIPTAVAKAPVGDDDDRKTLIEVVTRLGQGDPYLEVPPRILSAVEKAPLSDRLRRLLLELVVFPLFQHPALATCELPTALAGDSTVDAQALLRSIRDAAEASPPEHFGVKELKPAERRAFQSNAVLTVALLLALKGEWPTDILSAHLDEHLWRPQLGAVDHPPERAWLADSGSPALLGLVGRMWRKRLQERDRQLEDIRTEALAANEAKDHALRQAAAVERAKATVEALLSEREKEIAQLQGDLSAEREQSRVARSHAVDDYETLRTHLVRRLGRHAQLLEDGLHALRNGSAGVAEEHMERVIDALRTDLKGLRERSPLGGED